MVSPSFCVPGGLVGSYTPGWRSAISFGRPVDPPLVMIFQRAAVFEGNGSADRPSLGRVPTSRKFQPGTRALASPMISRGLASSTIACNSAGGSFDETLFGVAPSFQTAKTVSKNSSPFGTARVTMSPSRTPSSAS